MAIAHVIVRAPQRRYECEGGQNRLRLLCCLLRGNSKPRLVLVHSRTELPTTTKSTFLDNSIVIPSPLDSSTAMYSRQQSRHVQPLSSAYRDIRRDAIALQCKAAPRASAWPFRDQCSSNTRFLARQGALASTHRPLGIPTCQDVSLTFKPSADTYDLLR